MRTQMAKLAILLAMLLAAVNASAMTYYYSSYDNVTVNLNPSGSPVSVTVTLTLEGYTVWNFNPPAKHTGNLILIFGHGANSQTTGPVNPNTHMNLSASVTLDLTDSCFTDGTGCEVTQETANVMCTAAGQVFYGGGEHDGTNIAKQIPTSATIIENTKSTYSNQTWTSCDGRESAANQYGYSRCVDYQVLDQNAQDMVGVLGIDEAVSVVDQNVTPGLNTGAGVSNIAGQFLDGLVLLGPSALPSNACSYLKQTFTATGNSTPILVNCLHYTSTDVTITDLPRILVSAANQLTPAIEVKS